eukprot:2348882-Rhodomonas_salina.1
MLHAVWCNVTCCPLPCRMLAGAGCSRQGARCDARDQDFLLPSTGTPLSTTSASKTAWGSADLLPVPPPAAAAAPAFVPARPRIPAEIRAVDYTYEATTLVHVQPQALHFVGKVTAVSASPHMAFMESAAGSGVGDVLVPTDVLQPYIGRVEQGSMLAVRAERHTHGACLYRALEITEVGQRADTTHSNSPTAHAKADGARGGSGESKRARQLAGTAATESWRDPAVLDVASLASSCNFGCDVRC